MSWKKIVFSTLAILLGALMVVYGEIDDSPGGQLIGLLAVSFGVVGVIRSMKNHSGL